MVFPQMTKRLVRAVGRGGHDVADHRIVPGHDDAIDQELHQRAPLQERGVVQPEAHLGAERLARGGQRLRVEVLARDSVDLPRLRHEAVLASLQLLALAVELGEMHDPCEIGSGRGRRSGAGGGALAGVPAARGGSTAWTAMMASLAARSTGKRAWTATSAGGSWPAPCARFGQQLAARALRLLHSKTHSARQFTVIMPQRAHCDLPRCKRARVR